MVNSLHHVPEGAMRTALREAKRVLKSDGTLIVLEPLASGNSSQALKLVEDETAVRQAAQEAMEAAVSAGELEAHGVAQLYAAGRYPKRGRIFGSHRAILPSRREVIERDRQRITELQCSPLRSGTTMAG